MKTGWLLSLCFALSLDPVLAQTRESWLSTAESSNFVESGTYDEAVALCRRLDGASSFVEYRPFGTSPEGRELPLLLVDTSPGGARNDEPLVFIVAGIHSGEIDGKDAGLMLIRDCIIFHEHPGLLDGCRIAFVPIFNVDGHERRSPYNRINQRGPREQGWRMTSVNLNLNRDWLKADAAEMRAMVGLIDSLNPDFLMDIHVTDGADFQYAISYALNMYENELEPISTYGRRTFLPTVQMKMQAEGLTFVPYPLFTRGNDVTSGWLCPIHEPRYSTGYGSVINRPFILIETHSLKAYETRVEATHTYLRCAIETIKLTRAELMSAAYRADKLAAQLPGKSISLDWKTAPDTTMVKFLGYHSRIDSSAILGGPVPYWSDSAVTLSVPMFETHLPLDTTVVPYAYLVPAPWLERLEPTLAAHHIELARIDQPLNIDLSTYKFSNVDFEKAPFEGRFRVNFEATEVVQPFSLPPGSGIIFLDNRKSNIAVHLFEPRGPDSFVKWGYFTSIFEQAEWPEAYALDSVASRMLADSAELRAEFEAKLAADSVFASSKSQRMQFLYERSPYRDTRKDVYPIGRVTNSSQLGMLKKLVGRKK